LLQLPFVLLLPFQFILFRPIDFLLQFIHCLLQSKHTFIVTGPSPAYFAPAFKNQNQPTMEIKITLFITILLYAFIISQSFFYILAMSRVTKSMQPVTYIESRQLLDKNLQSSLSIVYYPALAVSIALSSFCVINLSGFLFICAILSLVSLIIDVALTLKSNVPLNKIINTWTASEYPANWKEYRSKWFSIYTVRQVVNITGFISLLAGLIFGFN
jgi:hypothetical protein